MPLNLINSLRMHFPFLKSTPARRRRQLRFAVSTEPLELRTLLTAAAADATASIVGGNLFLVGTSAGTRDISVTQETVDPTKIDIKGNGGTTINGSAATLTISASQIKGFVSVYLNNGTDGTGFTKLTVSASANPANTLSLPGSVFLTFAGNGNDTLTIHGNSSGSNVSTIAGSFYVSTGAGNDTLSVDHVSVGGVTGIDTGTSNPPVISSKPHALPPLGNDSVTLTADQLHTTYISEGLGGFSQVTITGGTLGTTSIYQAGSNQAATGSTGTNISGQVITGNLYLAGINGNQSDNIGGKVTGLVSVYLGNGNNALLFPGSGELGDTFGSIYVTAGTGSNDIESAATVQVNGGVTVVAGLGGTGNNFIGLASSNSGQTTVVTGNGNSVIFVGGAEFNPTPGSVTNDGAITIVTGNGINLISVSDVNATSLTVLTGTGQTTTWIGGSFTLPDVAPLNAFLNSRFGLTAPFLVNGGPANFSGGVYLQSLGGSNNTIVQLSTFGSYFILYDVGGHNGLNIDASTFNGTFAAYIGGTSNAINVAQHPGTVTFNALALFDLSGATSAGGGGTIKVGNGAADKAVFNSTAEFIGATVTTSISGSTFNGNTYYPFSTHSTVA